LNGRVWMPYQIAREFLKNRPKVIREQHDALKKAESLISSIQGTAVDELRKGLKDARLFEGDIASLDKGLREAIGKILPSVSALSGSLVEADSDPILDAIWELYEGRIGSRPSQAVLSTWLDQAQRRFEMRVPPGFEDRKKNDSNPFGDAFMWLEM